ncbi:hypothetical protein G1C97_1506 [Bifidobacterium sp. DSM 109959]|uniref:Uncharacterized protein n=1 Tax=Bifidobacterium olomucense TaxID=2675324 RepID=A0A7Y0HXZ1_9BIFI|nr:hypothetical protein [Bifidobacterium sp. DSM 109959]
MDAKGIADRDRTGDCRHENAPLSAGVWLLIAADRFVSGNTRLFGDEYSAQAGALANSCQWKVVDAEIMDSATSAVTGAAIHWSV